MEDYNFWRDLFDTYQSLPDWLKFAWLVLPPTFLLCFIALFMWFRLNTKPAQHAKSGDLIYSMVREENGQTKIYRHGSLDKGDFLPLLPAPTPTNTVRESDTSNPM